MCPSNSDQRTHPALAQLVALEGGNLSGRTDFLRRLTGMDSDPTAGSATVHVSERPSAYVGPEVYNAISGLAATVYGELHLHAGGLPEHAPVAPLVTDLQLDTLRSRNPFTLSGGEQVMLAVTSALALRPVVLAIDCALEQLDSTFKARLLGWLRHESYRETATVVADNRLDEYGSFAQTLSAAAFEQGTSGRRLRIEPIRLTNTPRTAPSRPCRITVDVLSFAYKRGSTVLQRVSVELMPGLYFLEGRNGAGKSTLAKLLSGVLRPAAGRILLDGTEYRPWKRPGQLVAYHFQNPDLQLFSTSVEAEVKAGPRARGLTEDECAERAAEVIELFGLAHVLHQHPLDLPFVVRKRIALAATLAMGCPWVILDEPTLGQDKDASEEIAKLILMLRDLGVGVVVISHWSWLRRRLGGIPLRLVAGQLTVGEGVG